MYSFKFLNRAYFTEIILQPTHKIHSSDGDLQLTLSIVPKFLEKLVNELLPEAFIISFKVSLLLFRMNSHYFCSS